MMNVQKVEIVEVDVESIVPSPFQTRKHFAEDDIAGLAQNIVERGLLHPVVIRFVDDNTVPELIAGERRLRAWRLRAGELGQDIPCRVIDVDDSAAAEMVVSENMQRVDLSPLEEAAGIDALLKTGRGKDEIASILGRSRTWVVRRANLINLSDDVKAKLDDPKSDVSKWELRCLEELAKYPPDIQGKVTKCWMSTVTPGAISDNAARLLQDLDKAVFDTAECAGCTARTGACKDLFEDIDGLGHCLNDECYENKMQQWCVEVAEKVKKDNPGKLIFSHWNGGFDSVEGVLGWDSDGYECYHIYDDDDDEDGVKPGDVTGIVINLDGSTSEIIVRRDDDDDDDGPVELTPEQKAEREKRQREDKAVRFAKQRLNDNPVDINEFEKKRGSERLISLLAAVCLSYDNWSSVDEVIETWKQYRSKKRSWNESASENINEILIDRLNASRDSQFREAIEQAKNLFGESEEKFLAAVDAWDPDGGKEDEK